MIFFDTETCGLHGMPVLLQYAEDDDPTILYNLWKEPIKKTMDLIEYLCTQEVCAFNLVFDWFHINKFYNIIRLWPHKEDCPEDIIPALAILESTSRDGLCLKPKAALDLMLTARRGPYQSTMDRKDIKIKRVPTIIAYDLAVELEKRVPIKDIYFARKSKLVKWQVDDIIDEDGDIDPDFKNVVLRFAPSGALKTLVADIFPDEKINLFKDIAVKPTPDEVGWKPYDSNWPEIIHIHIDHWAYNKNARVYAEKDVIYLQKLHKYFGSPPAGDDDSELAAMLAAIRWKGYRVDIDRFKELKLGAITEAKAAPTAPSYVKKYIWPHLTDTQKVVIKDTTKATLEEIAKWEDSEAATRAQKVLDARTAQKEVELYVKIIKADRFHASFKIIGALSGRMSGADGLNPQGIKNTKEVRSCFPLAPEGMVLSGGDFASFEVTIAAAYYDDDKLNAELLSGKKIHALFGEELYPEEDYDSILATKGTDDDKYTKAKSSLFAMGLYGGTGYTVKKKFGIPEEVGDKAKANWMRRFPGIGKKQKEIENRFCSMQQPGGIGSKVEWHEPDEKVESMLGFPRYFTLENKICKVLFQLGENPPKKWQSYKFKVTRRDREQTAGGAGRTACFAAAFAIQSANLRAANNHVIQSTGAEITKFVQRKVCDMQPVGIHEWVVMPLNVHDELMVPVVPEKVGELETIVQDAVSTFRERIPLIAIEWEKHLDSWADK